MALTSPHRFDIERLHELCRTKEQETLRLEFKACNELKVGTELRDKKREVRVRQLEDVLTELTKDVTAFLNSAGGTLIYGVLEDGKSRAQGLDKNNAFNASDRASNIRAEKVIDWIRAHVQPSPMVDAYEVFLDSDDGSLWYLVLEMEQGQQAYQAKDHRFYKRVGDTVQPMEQYEVADVMNRIRAAVLDLRVEIQVIPMPRSTRFQRGKLGMAVTSTNFVASEHGALKLTLAYPLIFRSNVHRQVRPGELTIGSEQSPSEEIMFRWGIQKDSVVFPGDWFDFYGGFHILIPRSGLVPSPTYVFQAELFTVNSLSKRALFAIQEQPSIGELDVISVDALVQESIIESYWATYQNFRSVEALHR